MCVNSVLQSNSNMKLCIVMFICLLCSVNGDEFNLFGDAGQAYSLEVSIGSPEQKLRLIVDTGSTTLAVASYSRRDHDDYFHANNSSTLEDSGKEVQAKYSQGNWIGKYVTDFIKIPSIQELPKVRSDFAIITESHKFFMNGSGWQGLLGLAFTPVGAWGDHVIVGSWLDSIECYMDKPVSFKLKLCGVQSPTNATHYGKFSMIVDDSIEELNETFRTPILHKRWYEVGVLAVNVRHPNRTHMTDDFKLNPMTFIYGDPIGVMCEKLNAQKSIVDSGTTNIRLPDDIFKKVVDELREETQTYSTLVILDEFWESGEAACWPEPQNWLELPWLYIDLLSDEHDYFYITLEIPPQNYMRVVTARNNSGEGGTVSQFCYKLGLEAGGEDTVLGYTAMEGFEVIFNRDAGWIEWLASDCGPKVRVSGPWPAPYDFFEECKLTRSDNEEAVSIKAAQWALCAVSIIAAIVLVYLLAPCVKSMILKRRRSSTSTCRDALVDQELS